MDDANPVSPRRSIRIGRILGVDLRVHWTFAFLIVLIVLVNQSKGTSGILLGLLWIGAIFGSVLLHELAHCVIAKRDGVVVDDVLLIPIGGISQMESIPKDPRMELGIALAGPLTSLALAGVFAVLALVAGAHLWPPTLLAGSWLCRLAWLNLILGAFNLLPALPMDGGRVLRAALATREDRRTATLQAAKIARWIAGAMMIIGLVYDVWLMFIGVFVLFAVGAEERDALSDGPPDESET